eukprot:TRINITY_DN16284_c0_g1_i1.p1 TRINITY_DN16284_c0_g1~~TRINITY_DN16284_c0_g1_i1.p1  ORF type:complete len:128 (-),score=6.34 TRINITY_DN16284_c0_g1_i1:107-490(-)
MAACNVHSAETTDVLRGALLSVTSLVLLVTIHALPSLLHMVGVLVNFAPGAWQVDGAQNPTVGRGSVQDGDAAVTECCKDDPMEAVRWQALAWSEDGTRRFKTLGVSEVLFTSATVRHLRSARFNSA